jgi:macrolide transport system ATP-binding/permease protein
MYKLQQRGKSAEMSLGAADTSVCATFEIVLHDLRYGVRMLVRHAGSTAVTVLALAIGIGINTAVFTAYKAMIARPLDARNPTEMVNFALTRGAGAGTANFAFSYPDYEAYRDAVHSFSGLIAFRPTRVTLANAGGTISQRAAAAGSGLGKLGLLTGGASNTEFAFVFVVSENYFKVLGVNAVHGRTFESMGIPELVAAPPVLISENYWKTRFAGDPAMLGKTIFLNGLAVTIIGITPHDFAGTGIGAPAFWLPLHIEPLIQADGEWLHQRENQRYRIFGRLASGAGIGQAQAEMSSIADGLRVLHDPHSESAKPATALVWPGSPFPLPLKQYGGLQLSILLIMAAAGMVLVVACANVGSLQLARARSRQNELRTRLSLGAGRLRLIRQLLTENAVVGLLAGVLALLFTWALLKVLVMLASSALPVEFGTLVFDVTPDLAIFAYVFAVSLVAGMLSGLAPALESSRAALSSASRAGTAPVGSRRLQDILVAAQVALSLVLMIAGSMAIRSAVKTLATDNGYESQHVIDLNLQFPESSKYTPARKLALVQELRTRLAALPGVAAVTSARQPIISAFRTAAFTLDGDTPSTQHVQSTVHYAYVQANFFQTLGIPLLLGRGFQAQAGPEPSVVLSESAAKQLWPGQNPVGHTLRLGAVDEQFHNLSELFAAGPAYQVVGIARDTRAAEFGVSDSKRVYLPQPEDRLPNYDMLIRTQSDAAQVMRAIEPVVSSVDAKLTANSSTLEEALRQSGPFIVSSLAAAVASVVGLLGMLLALMGIWGTVSYIVVLRTREVGIRMAIGAQKRDVLALILRESTRPVLAGLIAGILLAVGASYLARGLLYGLNGVDGASVAGISLLFLAIALLASYPPARRAMRVDPMVALRYE